MNVYISALILILAAVLQVSALPYITGSGVNVDLVLLLVIAWGIIRGVGEGLLWGLMGGLLLDILSAVPFGTTMVVMGAIGALSGMRSNPLLRSSVFSPLIAAGVGTVLYDVLMMLLLALFGRGGPWMETLGGIVLPAALLNALVMVPIYWLFFWLNRRLEPEKKW